MIFKYLENILIWFWLDEFHGFIESEVYAIIMITSFEAFSTSSSTTINLVY